MRRGLTILELLIFLAIVGVLAALLLPAVISARESARRARCAHNLNQIGLALQNYISAYDALPPAGVDNDHDPPPGPITDHSMKARLLGFMDQEPLYSALNFSLPVNPYEEGGPYFDNVTASSTVVGAFLCPSDAARTASYPFANLGGVDYVAASTNYPNNLGVTPTYTGYVVNGPAYFLNKTTWSGPLVRPACCTDGLSCTAIFSEYVKGRGDNEDSGSPGVDLRRSFRIPWSTATGSSYGDYRVCQQSTMIQTDYKGEFWPHHHPGRGGGYFHTNPPNTKSCNGGYAYYGWVGVSSLHLGGVHVLALDGSVRFVRSSIDYRTWSAIGTMAGGEIISGDAW